MRATLSGQVRVRAPHGILGAGCDSIAITTSRRLLPVSGSSESARRHMFVNITTEADAAAGPTVRFVGVKNQMITNIVIYASHDRHHIYRKPHMFVIIVGLQNSCGESDTAFLCPL